ncbi:DUF3455 domain-containing protein [Krasilnikovia sp. MM14-A1004]|uniref:DUF3455 domain-containing protein n=1 Tax=Krasilnikovia sp. MM14-A1004 TaxID=3373541 RepID=UPI00399C82EA
MLSTRRSRIRAAAATGMAAVVVALGAVTFNASAQEVRGHSDTNPDLAPPPGSTKIAEVHVQKGTQTYTCTGGVFTGTPSTPEARLVGQGGPFHHFAGPSWQSEHDDSLVTATRIAAGPASPDAIPELLLGVNSHTGSGILSPVTHIQRLNTSGGVAPTGACTDGEKASVPYSATYVFWAAP